MLPPLILFVGLALTVALWFYTRELDNVGHYFSDAYEAFTGAIDYFRR